MMQKFVASEWQSQSQPAQSEPFLKNRPTGSGKSLKELYDRKGRKSRVEKHFLP
jgi:hypothetical protein